MLNPGSITDGNRKKEVAKPYMKIEAKVNNRMTNKPSKEIWTEEDFNEDNIIEDERPKPKFEVLYKQNVSSEDVYLGMSGKDNSSLSCDQLLLKVWLPNTLLKEIGLEVKEQSVHLQTSNYLLNHTLQYKVDKDKADAKWDKEKGLLQVTMKVIKPDIFDEFLQNEN